MYHRAAHTRMERDRQHRAASDLSGSVQAGKSITYLDGEATGVIDNDGVVWDGSDSVHIWVEVDIG